MTGKREKRKDISRANILRAAEELIRETGSTDFSMNNLAARAGVSVPTPYNLVGSKAAILYSLLHSYQDRLDAIGDEKQGVNDPYREVMRAADAAASVYTSDGPFIRPLMLFLLGVNESDHRSIYMNRGFQYWLRAMSNFDGHSELIGLNLQLMAREMLIFFTGLFDFWVNFEIDDDEFRASARYGTALKLLPFSDGGSRAFLLNIMQDTESELSIPFRSLRDIN